MTINFKLAANTATIAGASYLMLISTDSDLPDGVEDDKQANNTCTSEQKKAFKDSLYASMEPFFSVTGRELCISLYNNGNTNPMVFIDVAAAGQLQQVSDDLPPKILVKADELMTTHLIQTWENHPGHLRVGILDQAHYWTAAHAKLLAATLLRNYGHQLEQACVEKNVE